MTGHAQCVLLALVGVTKMAVRASCLLRGRVWPPPIAPTFALHPWSVSKRQYSDALEGKVVKIGCASGFWGDTAVSTSQLVHRDKLNYIVYDYLSEITMSLLTAQRKKMPDLGFTPDFVLDSIAPNMSEIKRKGIRIVSNAGGVNPHGCAAALKKVCEKVGVELKIAVIDGDDVMPQLDQLKRLGVQEMSTGEELPSTVNSMNAYFGAGPISKALDLGADIVVTGRCTDSALVLGPLMHEFQWGLEDFDRLAAGSLAGHLVECGGQVTGGIYTDWDLVEDWADLGFPVVECSGSGDFIVTKPPGTGGLVSTGTVSEQLLYEIGDPRRYILPDVVCDFSNVQLKELGPDRVLVKGAKGLAPTADFKVCATYMEGYRATAVALVGGPRSREKILKTADAILKRCRMIFSHLKIPDFLRVQLEIIGGDSETSRDAVLWLAVQHPNKKALEIFAKEIAPAGTGMAPGLCGLVGGRPKVSPVLRLFSFLYPKDKFQVNITVDGKEEKYEAPQVATGSYPKEVGAEAASDPSSSALPTGSHSFRLEELALTRSGDKGDSCNIGVVARHPSYLPYLRQAVTAEAVEEYFKHMFSSQAGPLSSRVERFDVPGIHGMNFVLLHSLGGGGVSSLRTDPQGKSAAQRLLDFEIKNVPDLVGQTK